jgi:hypothetical protein
LESSPYHLFCCSSLCEKIKLFICTAAVSFLVLVIVVGVILKYAVLQLHSMIIFVLLFFRMILLVLVENLHNAVVVVEKWDMSLSFPLFAEWIGICN